MGPRAVAARISRAKNEMQTPGEYAAAATDFTEERTAKIYSIYQERLRASHAVDFDDLLMLTVLLFRDHAHVLEYYQNLWRYVLVDEYQDTNHAQYQIVNFLSRRHGNLCVVGDDDQSIYRWRGADLNNILDFERDHPGCRVIKLEQNYRSTQNILDAAGGVVANNRGRKGKALWTENPGGEPLVVYQARDEQAEAEFVSQRVRELAAENGRSLDDFAVFYRTNAQSRVLEDALRRDLTPYVIVGRPALLRAEGSQGPGGLPSTGGQPGRRAELQADRERPAARNRGGDGREAGGPGAGRARLDLGGVHADRRPEDPGRQDPEGARRAGRADREGAGQARRPDGARADRGAPGDHGVPGRPEERGDRRGRDPPGEPAGAGVRRPGVHGAERGPHPAGVPGQRGADRRHRRDGRGDGNGHADDAPLGQGAGVSGGVPDRVGGGGLSPRPRAPRRCRAGRGASALLRRA